MRLLSRIIKAAQLQVIIAAKSSELAKEELRILDTEEPVAEPMEEFLVEMPEEEMDPLLEERRLLEEEIEEAKIALKEAKDEARQVREELEEEVTFTRTQTEAKANMMLQNAEDEAHSLLEQAKIEGERIRVKRYEEGYEIGYKTGYEEGTTTTKKEIRGEVAVLFDLLHKAIEDAAEKRASALALCEDDFLKFGLLLAEKIIKRQLIDEPAWLKPVIKEGIARLRNVSEMTIRLHPQDFAELSRDRELLALGTFQWEADSSLSLGSYVIDSDYGGIDARLEKRLGKLAQGLMDVIYDGE